MGLYRRIAMGRLALLFIYATALFAPAVHTLTHTGAPASHDCQCSHSGRAVIHSPADDPADSSPDHDHRAHCESTCVICQAARMFDSPPPDGGDTVEPTANLGAELVVVPLLLSAAFDRPIPIRGPPICPA